MVMSAKPWFSTRTVVRGCGIGADFDFEPPHAATASPSIAVKKKRRVSIDSLRNDVDCYLSLETARTVNVPRCALVRRESEVDSKMSRVHRLCHALRGHTVCRPGPILFTVG